MINLLNNSSNDYLIFCAQIPHEFLGSEQQSNDILRLSSQSERTLDALHCFGV